MSKRILNVKRRRDYSEKIYQEPPELEYYPYSKNKNLKQDLIDNPQESFKKKKLDENSNQNDHTLSFNDSSKSNSSTEMKYYPYIINEIIYKKYKLISHISNGTFGCVFKCENILTKDILAIKIITLIDENRYENSKVESSLLKKISSLDKKNKSHCLKVFDSFMFTKNKIQYYAIVTELLDINLFQFLKLNSYNGYTMSQIQHIAKQILEGIAFLNKLNIIHTDLKPENILLINSEFDKITKYEEVPLNITSRQDNNRQDINSVRNASAFSTSISVSSLENTKTLYKKLKSTEIKIIDFGAALELKDRGSWTICTRQYRPPEVILECCQWGPESDIWSLGCILVELYTGELVFPTYNNQEHLSLIEKTCGHYPNWMIKNAGKEEIKNLFVDCTKHKGDKVLDIRRCDNYEEVKKALLNQRTLEESISPKHSNFFKFIQYLMKIDPKKRPSAKEALNHQFFKILFKD